MNFLSDAADAVGLDGVADAIEGGIGGALGSVFLPILDGAAESALQWLGPEAGRVAVEKMTEKYPVLEKVENARETAINAAAQAVMSFHDDIMDFAKDALSDPIGAFKKVGVLLLRACKEAAKMAVNALIEFVQGMCCCACLIEMFGDLQAIIEQAYEVIVEAMKTFVNDQLSSRGVPSVLLSQINWDFSPDDDIGEPPARRGMGQEAQQPEPQVMGAPDTDVEAFEPVEEAPPPVEEAPPPAEEE
mmetsp:Transcript_127328/g.396308  ORF Transcript_127328/g.396308 Transcript_127328/m.396308 type:complete len:246 (-) Transcript_127328:9-746(-)